MSGWEEEREIEKERWREGREEERVCQSVREGVLEQLDELESEWVSLTDPGVSLFLPLPLYLFLIL